MRVWGLWSLDKYALGRPAPLSVISCVILLFVERLEVCAVFHVTWSPQGGKIIECFFDCVSVNISALLIVVQLFLVVFLVLERYWTMS